VPDVDYTCRACGIVWMLWQGLDDPDPDLTLCPDCIGVMFDPATRDLHGTHDDPWTDEKIREARGL
jgi:hypothetical protein